MGSSEHDFILKVIEKYKSHECLWQICNEQYHNKRKRNAALDDLLELFKKKDPKANRDTVQKKIISMRSSYNKELRKVKASQTKGSNSDIHVPKLWYYSYLSFLQDQDFPRKSKTVSSILDNLPLGEDEPTDSIDDNVQSPESSNSPSSAPTLRSKRPAPKVDVILEKIAKRMDRPIPSTPVTRPKQPHDAFGEHVSEKLRSITPSMVPYCQKLINDAIFFAEIGSLNISSKIVTPEVSDPATYRMNTVNQDYFDAMDDEDSH